MVHFCSQMIAQASNNNKYNVIVLSQYFIIVLKRAVFEEKSDHSSLHTIKNKNMIC